MSFLKTMTSLFSPGGGVPRLSPTEAARRVRDGKAVLVDVREPDEWRDGVAAPAVLLPMSDLGGEQKRWKPFLEMEGGREIILYCRSGNRSGRVARILAAQGYHTANAGGFDEWRASGLPVEQR